MPAPKTEVFSGKPIHITAAALIQKDSKILLLDRMQPPYGLACPAGHVDEGEAPLAAVKREVAEETGLRVRATTLLAEEIMDWNICSRGVKGHHWYVYSCTVTGQLKPNKHEAKSMAWYDVADIRKNSSQLEPAWQYWLKKLEIL